MIDLKNLKIDLDSSVSNFSLLYRITAWENQYNLSTQSITFDGVYYNDLIMKVGGSKESIDLRTKKIKLGNSSITINNSLISGKRFTDSIRGEMFGGKVDVYLKTQSCEILYYLILI